MPVYMYHFATVWLAVGSSASNWCLMNFCINTTNSRSFEKYKIIDYIVDAFLLQEMHTGHFVWSWGGGVQVERYHHRHLCCFAPIGFNQNRNQLKSQISAQTLTVKTLEFTTSASQIVWTGDLLGP